MKQQGGQFEKSHALAERRQDLSEKEQARLERVSKAEYGYGDDTGGATGLAYRREDRARRQVSATERLAAAKESEPMQQFSRYMTGKPQPARLIGLSKQVPAFEPIVNVVLDGITQGEINDRWDAYYLLKGSEAIHLQTARDNLEKEISSLAKKGKHTQAAQLGEIYNQLRPGFLEQFFGFPQEMMPPEAKMSLKAPAEKVTWGTETKGPGGTLRQKSSSGKISTTYKPPAEGKSEVAKTKEDLADLYKYHIGQYNQASRGVGQFIEDPNKERVAKESLERALTIAIEHKKAGGNPAELGITPESIRAQFKAGNMEQSKAVALLQVLFGME